MPLDAVLCLATLAIQTVVQRLRWGDLLTGLQTRDQPALLRLGLRGVKEFTEIALLVSALLVQLLHR